VRLGQVRDAAEQVFLALLQGRQELDQLAGRVRGAQPPLGRQELDQRHGGRPVGKGRQGTEHLAQRRRTFQRRAQPELGPEQAHAAQQRRLRNLVLLGEAQQR
jgi:hypothetical protein